MSKFLVVKIIATEMILGLLCDMHCEVGAKYQHDYISVLIGLQNFEFHTATTHLLKCLARWNDTSHQSNSQNMPKGETNNLSTYNRSLLFI